MFVLFKICSKLSILLENLKLQKTNDKFSNDKIEFTYKQLASLAFSCMTRFSGYPQLYKPIHDIIEVII